MATSVNDKIFGGSPDRHRLPGQLRVLEAVLGFAHFRDVAGRILSAYCSERAAHRVVVAA